MSQGDILRVLKKEKWMSAKEIAGKLKISVSTVHTSLRKLRESQDIIFKEFWYEGKWKGWIYRLK